MCKEFELTARIGEVLKKDATETRDVLLKKSLEMCLIGCFLWEVC